LLKDFRVQFHAIQALRIARDLLRNDEDVATLPKRPM
jgi:hypothetical protein